MKKLYLTMMTLTILFLVVGVSRAQIIIGDNTEVVFASVEEGRAILMARDDFVQRLSPFDRAARLKTDRDVSEQEYLAFVGNSVLAWPDNRRTKIESIINGIRSGLGALHPPLPDKIYMITTSGAEEGNAAYTRSNAIILPSAFLSQNKTSLRQIVAHEIFHVVSRHDPRLRDRFYQVIGFHKCNEIEFPPSLAHRKITNPDAPVNQHCIRLLDGGTPVWTIPILYSSTEKYDVATGGEFFQYLSLQFLIVDRGENPLDVKPVYEGSSPKFLDWNQWDSAGFWEQVGNNTGYIIHPEEILADNFALLVTGNGQVFAPEIISNMREVLTGPDIVLSTTRLDFGYVEPGGSKTRTLEIANLGAGTLLFNGSSSIVVEGGDSFAVNYDSLDLSDLAPKAAPRTVVVIFSPAAASTKEFAELIVTTNAPFQSPLTVTLSGRGERGKANVEGSWILY